jgi:hypothetical protein
MRIAQVDGPQLAMAAAMQLPPTDHLQGVEVATREQE